MDSPATLACPRGRRIFVAILVVLALPPLVGYFWDYKVESNMYICRRCGASCFATKKTYGHIYTQTSLRPADPWKTTFSLESLRKEFGLPPCQHEYIYIRYSAHEKDLLGDSFADGGSSLRGFFFQDKVFSILLDRTHNPPLADLRTRYEKAVTEFCAETDTAGLKPVTPTPPEN